MAISSKVSQLMNISRQIEMMSNPIFLALTEGTYNSVVTFNTVYAADIDNGVGSSDEILTDGTQTIAFPPHGSNATVVKISSNNANDTSDGTGARTLYVEGLDENYNKINETVTMNGQTAVLTTNKFSRINRLIVQTSGTNTGLTIGKFGDTCAPNLGTLYCGDGVVTAGVPATIYSTVQPLKGWSRQAVMSIPTGYFPILLNPASICGANKLVEFKIYFRFGYEGCWIETFSWQNFQQMGNLNFSVGGIYYVPGDVMVVASGATSPAAMILAEFIMIRNDLLAELQAELGAL
jgi:hypothetical protein